jgi:hypothetical protein
LLLQQYEDSLRAARIDRADVEGDEEDLLLEDEPDG